MSRLIVTSQPIASITPTEQPVPPTLTAPPIISFTLAPVIEVIKPSTSCPQKIIDATVVCSSNFTWNKRVSKCAVQGECPPEFFPSGDSPICWSNKPVCPTGSTLINGGCSKNMICPTGYTEDGVECIKDPEELTCRAGYTPNNDVGNCYASSDNARCPTGSTYDSGICYKPALPLTCPTGYVDNGAAGCTNADRCPTGYTLSAGICYKRQDNPTCPTSEYYWDGTNCSKCSTGYTSSGNWCYKPPSCPSGTNYEGGNCWKCPTGYYSEGLACFKAPTPQSCDIANNRYGAEISSRYNPYAGRCYRSPGIPAGKNGCNDGALCHDKSCNGNYEGFDGNCWTNIDPFCDSDAAWDGSRCRKDRIWVGACGPDSFDGTNCRRDREYVQSNIVCNPVAGRIISWNPTSRDNECSTTIKVVNTASNARCTDEYSYNAANNMCSTIPIPPIIDSNPRCDPNIRFIAGKCHTPERGCPTGFSKRPDSLYCWSDGVGDGRCKDGGNFDTSSGGCYKPYKPCASGSIGIGNVCASSSPPTSVTCPTVGWDYCKRTEYKINSSTGKCTLDAKTKA